EAVQRLIDRGADVNAAGGDGGTALHAAAFLGHQKTVDVLIRNDANLNVANKDGSTPLDTAVLDEGTTRYFASVLQLDLDENGLGRRKAAIAETLRQHGATAGRNSGLANILMQIPLFNHLWFLWFLWWLVVGYATVSAIGSRLPSVRLPSWLVLSPARYLWLTPLTMIPQWFMGDGGSTPIFGPDTSTGPLPIPHVFAYYAIFFGFGTLDFKFDDGSVRIGRRWWLPLAIGLLVILPLGLALLGGWSGPASFTMSPLSRRVLSVLVQAAYPWFITFGLMSLFRRYCPADNASMRYLSDSAYWLYLAHLPLIIAAQLAVKDWPIPALAKFLLIVTVVTSFLLWTYQTLVRYTWLGRFLNGPRARPVRAGTPAIVA
ncbi:ankyrin repeat domain-containing protein, partial [Singulisphaera rosea]